MNEGKLWLMLAISDRKCTMRAVLISHDMSQRSADSESINEHLKCPLIQPDTLKVRLDETQRLLLCRFRVGHMAGRHLLCGGRNACEPACEDLGECG